MTQTSRTATSSPRELAVVLGNDGSLTLEDLAGYKRVVAATFAGQDPLKGAACWPVHTPGDAAIFVDEAFPDYTSVFDLASADFFEVDTHPELRSEILHVFPTLLHQFGNDVLDNLQGAVHLAANADLLLRAPETGDIHFGKAPVIAIGSGPSVREHLAKLRSLQDTCILVCADTALSGLLEEGIRPHFCTPVERVPEIVDCLPEDTGETIFLGCPLVHPEAVRRFKRHVFSPGHDVVYDWVSPGTKRYSHGPSSGTMSIYRACRMTDGPVYLVGHDLAHASGQTHWQGATAIPEIPIAGFSLPGNGGDPVATIPFWQRLHREIGMSLRGRGNVFNTNLTTGAKIDHTENAPLPSPVELSSLGQVTLPDAADRRAPFMARKARLAKDARRMLKKLDTAHKPSDVSMATLCPGENAPFFNYLFRSVYAQMSFERRFGFPTDHVVDWTSTALRNVVTECAGIFEEIAGA